MSDLLQLRTRVREYLDESTAVYWTDPELNGWINQSYFYEYRLVAEAAEGYFTVVTTHNITATVAEIPLPSDHWRTRLVERIYQTFTVPMRYFARNESANIISNTNFSGLYLPTFRFRGNNLLLEPTPDTTIINAIRHEYLPQPVAMVIDTDTPDAGFLEMWEEAVVLRAAISAKQKEEAVVNSGTDIGPLALQLQTWEQMIKESAELRTTHRHYTEQFGLDDGSATYYP